MLDCNGRLANESFGSCGLGASMVWGTNINSFGLSKNALFIGPDSNQSLYTAKFPSRVS